MIFSSCAKWILTGEHSVIRNGKAIVFPYEKFRNILEFTPGNSIELVDCNINDVQFSLENMINNAAKFSGLSKSCFVGTYRIDNDIPIKTGLGSSAALCSNFVKLCKSFGYSGDDLELGRNLENEFHGNSSGMDVAASLFAYPLIFENNKVLRKLQIPKMPNFKLTYCGVSSSTSTCVRKVQDLFQNDFARASKLDHEMNRSAELCIEGIESCDLNALADGINLGAKIFEEWGLMNDALANAIKDLKEQGAIAAKPIGSGLGGYVVSLFK